MNIIDHSANKYENEDRVIKNEFRVRHCFLRLNQWIWQICHCVCISKYSKCKRLGAKPNIILRDFTCQTSGWGGTVPKNQFSNSGICGFHTQDSVLHYLNIYFLISRFLVLELHLLEFLVNGYSLFLPILSSWFSGYHTLLFSQLTAIFSWSPGALPPRRVPRDVLRLFSIYTFFVWTSHMLSCFQNHRHSDAS